MLFIQASLPESAHWNGLLLYLYDLLPEECSAFLGSLAPRDFLPRDSLKQWSAQTKACPPQVQGSGFAELLPSSLLSLRTKIKSCHSHCTQDASGNLISHQCCSVCKQQLPGDTSTGGLTSQLCQEVLFHLLQEPPGVSPVCWMGFQQTPGKLKMSLGMSAVDDVGSSIYP